MPESLEDEILRRKGLQRVNPVQEKRAGNTEVYGPSAPKQKYWGEKRLNAFKTDNPNAARFFGGVRKIGGIVARPIINSVKQENKLRGIKNKAYNEALEKEIAKAAKEKAKTDSRRIVMNTGRLDMNEILFGTPARKPQPKSEKTIRILFGEEKKKKKSNPLDIFSLEL